MTFTTDEVLRVHVADMSGGGFHRGPLPDESLTYPCAACDQDWPCDARLMAEGVARYFPYYFRYRCEYVDCHNVEPHEHGGGQPMREMTAEERALISDTDR